MKVVALRFGNWQRPILSYYELTESSQRQALVGTMIDIAFEGIDSTHMESLVECSVPERQC